MASGRRGLAHVTSFRAQPLSVRPGEYEAYSPEDYKETFISRDFILVSSSLKENEWEESRR